MAIKSLSPHHLGDDQLDYYRLRRPIQDQKWINVPRTLEDLARSLQVIGNNYAKKGDYRKEESLLVKPRKIGAATKMCKNQKTHL